MSCTLPWINFSPVCNIMHIKTVKTQCCTHATSQYFYVTENWEQVINMTEQFSNSGRYFLYINLKSQLIKCFKLLIDYGEMCPKSKQYEFFLFKRRLSISSVSTQYRTLTGSEPKLFTALIDIFTPWTTAKNGTDQNICIFWSVPFFAVQFTVLHVKISTDTYSFNWHTVYVD